MSLPPTIKALDEAAPVQHRIWFASRLAWWGMAGILILAAAGAFGDGPLAHAEARDGDRLLVAYERFQRSDAATAFELTFASPPAGTDPAFCLDTAFLEVWQISRIEPTPLREELGTDGICHVIARGAAGQAPLTLRFWAHPRHSALLAEGAIYAPGGARVGLRAHVWP